jgi:hypothetical protein
VAGKAAIGAAVEPAKLTGFLLVRWGARLALIDPTLAMSTT